MIVGSGEVHVLREQVCEIGRRLWQRGLVAAHDGNISVRLDSESLLCTPTSMSKGFLNADDLVIVNQAGIKLEGRLEPSSELKMHLAIYGRRPDVNAVVHAHPPHGTAFALRERALPQGVMPEIDVLLGETPVVPFSTPGTQKFADAVGSAASGGANVFILARHGITTCGTTLQEAWFRMESLDHCCRILLAADKIA